MPEPDAARAELDLMIGAAEAAGEIALRHFAGDRKSTDKPGGAGPVTEADLEVDHMLSSRLRTARPDYGWLSEETPDAPDRLSKTRVFIVDPIDGTQAFVDGHRSFAHSLALVEQGEVLAGVVFLPARDKLYTALRGQGAWLNGAPLRATSVDAERDATVLTTRGNLDPRHWPGGVPPLARHYRPSLAYRMALVGEGRFDAMLTFRQTWEWDVAAGSLIVTEAGGRVSDRVGRAPVFNRATPQLDGMVAAADGLHRRLVARMARTAR